MYFHLRVLREAGFVRAERRGPFIFCCLAGIELLRILQDLKQSRDAHRFTITNEAKQHCRLIRDNSPAAKTKEVT